MMLTLPQFLLACLGVMISASILAMTVATALVKLGVWGGDKNAVLQAVKEGVGRVEQLVDDFREEIREDFKQLSAKVDRLAETVAGHSEAIATLKGGNRGR